jgi:hypothetical protein
VQCPVHVAFGICRVYFLSMTSHYFFFLCLNTTFAEEEVTRHEFQCWRIVLYFSFCSRRRNFSLLILFTFFSCYLYIRTLVYIKKKKKSFLATNQVKFYSCVSWLQIDSKTVEANFRVEWWRYLRGSRTSCRYNTARASHVVNFYTPSVTNLASYTQLHLLHFSIELLFVFGTFPKNFKCFPNDFYFTSFYTNSTKTISKNGNKILINL